VSIQFHVSVSFTAATTDEAAGIVNAWALPAGAMVTTQASQVVGDASGEVDDGGNIVPPEPPPVPEDTAGPVEDPADG